ncbi:hypothetical protein OROGR_026890 [Orobanche gracilis]
MKLNFAFLVIVHIAAAALFYCVAANSKEGVTGTITQILSKSNDRVNETDDPVKANNSGKNDPNQHRKVDVGAQKGLLKENRESGSASKNEPKEGGLLSVMEKCDSSSNRCTDDNKTFVACMRVPGNESPALSLLIQNTGKGSISIRISAPDIVQMEKKQIELQENKYTEVKVSIKGVESGHLIILSAGHGNCSLSFRDQFTGMKKIGESYFNSIFNLTLPKGFLFSAALLLLVVSVFTSTRLGRKYFARKDPKYQTLDMELPVSHGIKLESSGNAGWDNSWGDNWDDEETPITPSFTPSLSSQGMASRKLSKEGWN